MKLDVNQVTSCCIDRVNNFTGFGIQKFEFVKYHYRYNLNIVFMVTKIKHFMAYGREDVKTITAVARVSIICAYA